MNHAIETLSSTAAANQWKQIGLHKRSGLMAPLFSVFSKKSIGIGDFGDLIPLGEVCKKMGGSILQLLPINDSGSSFMPYDSQSSFALDPMYLPLRSLKGVDLRPFTSEIQTLKKAFPIDPYRVNYGIKAKKLELLWNVFQHNSHIGSEVNFLKYVHTNSDWIEDYAIYKVLQHVLGEQDWQKWPQQYRDRDMLALKDLKEKNSDAMIFHQWLQYLCFEKMRSIKKTLNKAGVLLMGDLPFLVSKSSADVWSFPHCFKLYLSSGAPPDYFMAAGQRWGMPPYNWKELEADGYRYFKSKLAYAAHFYDMYRIDHAIGFFRVWTIDNNEPAESAGRNGTFDPSDESIWQSHGEKLFRMALSASSMLPCAEDLGMVPPCSEPTLELLGIPGMEVQRWTTETDHRLSRCDEYRAIAIAVLSTHDTLPISPWWDSLNEEEKKKYSENLQVTKEQPTYLDVLEKAFEFILQARSIFAIHSIQDVLNFTDPSKQDHCMKNINYPGTFGDMNWTWRCPIPVDRWGFNERLSLLKNLSEKYGRR